MALAGMPAPVSRRRKKGPVGMIRQRLRQLADDCEERARRSRNADARSLYHRAAKDARQAYATSHLSEGELHDYLQAMNAQALLARWYDGSEWDSSPDKLSAGFAPFQSVMVCTKSAPANIDLTGAPGTPIDACPPDAMNARQIGQLCGIPERTARRAIERGWGNRWPGFYRKGRYGFAELDAFNRLRG